jgi:hypothetical protein
VKSRLNSLPRAPSTEDAVRNSEGRGSSRTGGDPPTGRVEPPSSRYTRYNEGDVFEISVPSNWRELADGDAVTFAPNGAYGTHNGQNVFTHGMQIGIARNESHDLETASHELVEAFARGNPQLRGGSGFERISVDGHRALRTTLTNINEVTRQEETIQMVTTELRNGDVLYALGVAPSSAYNTYRTVFNRIIGSIRIA